MLQYMQMVLEMAMYIRAVRTANWELHLEATINRVLSEIPFCS